MSEQEQKQQSAQERLQSILGFDPTKSGGNTGVLNDALSEIKKERDERNKKKASELIKKAIECVEKMDELKSQFNSTLNKSEKELSKLISSIEQLGK